MKTIGEWQRAVHDLAVEKGWYDSSRTPLEVHMLVVSELAEATESVRNGSEFLYFDGDGKPEGELVELADAVIRIMDYCESQGWNLENAVAIKHAYNTTREYRHGGKRV